MKPTIFFTICICLLLLGCAGQQQTGGSETEQATTDEPAAQEDLETGDSPEPAAEMRTAKEGYAEAETLAKRQASDAAFVGVTAMIDKDGKSESWAYSFDSLKRSKGLEITDGVWREKAFSFQKGMAEWVDSPKAAAVCGAGEATLEAGKWTISGETDACEIDAKTGEKDGN